MSELAGRRTYFRRSLVVPTEHGAWSWLLTPLLVGVVVGRASLPPAAHALPAVLLLLVGSLSAYMIRQPATAFLRIRQGRGRRADQSTALGWAVGFSVLALVCFLGLAALDRSSLAGLAFPFSAVLAAYLLAARGGRATLRSLWMELAGAAGLALTAPAAFVAVSGRLVQPAFTLWALMALQNMLGVLYVRQRLADSKGLTGNRRLTLWGHVAGFAAVLVAAALGWLPMLAAAPFAGFLARAVWAVQRPRPIPNIKRFGFSEVGVELLGGALISLGYLLA